MPRRIGESDVGDRPSSKWSGSYTIGAGLSASGSVAGGAHPNPFALDLVLVRRSLDRFRSPSIAPGRTMDQSGRHVRSPVQGVLRDHVGSHEVAPSRCRMSTHQEAHAPSNTLMACVSTAAPILP